MKQIPRPSPATLIALVALMVAIGGTAYATGEGKPILGGQRNPGSDRSKALASETQIIADNGTYGTRQSNKSGNGGGAIYGCRSGAGGTTAKNEPCIRANNLSTGYAFEFASSGSQGGLITTSDVNGRPFTTSATGVATGLNADRLDSLDADQIVAKARAGLAPLTKLTFASSSAADADAQTARAAATDIALGAFPPFTIYGKCFIDSDADGGQPQLRAEVFARTSQDGAMLAGQTDTLSGAPAFLNTGTAESARQIDLSTASADAASITMASPSSTLVASDGSAFEFRAITGAKQGTLSGGNGVWGDGNRCAFGLSRFAGS